MCYTINISEDTITAKLAEIFQTTVNDATLYGIGDDCALFASAAPGGATLVSTDILVENVHFRREWSSAATVAERAFAQNLADIAASGGTGIGMVVSLVLPDNFCDDARNSRRPEKPKAVSEASVWQSSHVRCPVCQQAGMGCHVDKSTRNDRGERWVFEFAESLALCAREEGVAILGGDLAKSKQGGIVVNITVFGEPYVKDGVVRHVRRDGAKPGDIIGIVGHQGFSLTGYELLTELSCHPEHHLCYPEYPHCHPDTGSKSGMTERCHPELDSGSQKREHNFSKDEKQQFIDAFLAPMPPYQFGPVAADCGATAMMDISDGLLKDADRLARASGVCFKLDERAKRLDMLVRTATHHYDAEFAELYRKVPLENYYFGGEDHALLATFGERDYNHGGAIKFPMGFTAIGKVVAVDDDVNDVEGATKWQKLPNLSVILSENDAEIVNRSRHKLWDHFTR